MARFREHRERLKLQQQQAEIVQGKAVQLTAPTQHDSLMIVVNNELEKIKALPTFEQRAEYKRLYFLPKFLPLVEEYFVKNEHYQNDLVGYCVVFLFDVGDFNQAITLTDRAIGDQQKMPATILRSFAHFAADQLFDFTERAINSGQSAEPYFSQILDKITMSDWLVSEMVMAKWYKLLAKLLLLARELNGKVKTALVNEPRRLELAILAAASANQYNHKIGVNNLIERCFMRLSALSNLNLYTEEKLNAFNKSLQEGRAKGFTEAEIAEVKAYLRTPSLSLEEVAEQLGVADV